MSDLQERIFDHYSQYLQKHGGKRPKSKNSTHVSVNSENLKRYEGNWDLLLSAINKLTYAGVYAIDIACKKSTPAPYHQVPKNIFAN